MAPKKDNGRRDFLKKTGASLAALGCGASCAVKSTSEKTGYSGSGPRWAMVIDASKCAAKDGCNACTTVCHKSHNVPNFDGTRHEIKWLWKEEHERVFPTQVHHHTPKELLHRPTLVLCNHCERPPCVRVCPTQATWKRDDGLVAMDMHRCIGCRYCVVACPYGSRSFNWKDPRDGLAKQGVDLTYPTRMKGVVEKCNFCAELLARGNPTPLCVEACQKKGNGALVFGDLANPASKVSELVKKNATLRRKPGLGTEPHVFYIV